MNPCAQLRFSVEYLRSVINDFVDGSEYEKTTVKTLTWAIYDYVCARAEYLAACQTNQDTLDLSLLTLSGLPTVWRYAIRCYISEMCTISFESVAKKCVSAVLISFLQ